MSKKNSEKSAQADRADEGFRSAEFGGSKTVSERTRLIFKACYNDYARQWYVEFEQYADSFLRSYIQEEPELTEDKFNVSVSSVKIDSIVESIILDIIRYKEYHFSCISQSEAFESDGDVESDSTDSAGAEGDAGDIDDRMREHLMRIHGQNLSSSKVAAYVAKWCLKHAPIMIYPKGESIPTPDERRKIDLVNSAYALLFALHMMAISPRDLHAERVRELIYHFTYRQYHDRSFFIIFDLIRNNARLKSNLLDLQRFSNSENAAPEPGETEGRSKNISGKPAVSTKRKTPKKQPRTAPKPYSIFVAAPRDCKKLRDAAREVIDEINEQFPKHEFKLNPYFWEDYKKPEITDSFQKRIFEEVEEAWGKTKCDILLTMVWHRFGENTRDEFDYFTKNFRLHNKANQLLWCHYDERVSPHEIDAESMKRLNEWVESIENQIAPLGRERRAIKTVRRFRKELRIALNSFLFSKMESV